MKSRQGLYKTSLIWIFVSIFSFGQIGAAYGAMISTAEAVSQSQTHYDKASLREAINSIEVREKLETLGVDPQQVADRIDSLTPLELAQLNQEIDNMPAGEGVLGVLLLLFLVFIVTDMLCATDLFSFVKCINR